MGADAEALVGSAKVDAVNMFRQDWIGRAELNESDGDILIESKDDVVVKESGFDVVKREDGFEVVIKILWSEVGVGFGKSFSSEVE